MSKKSKLMQDEIESILPLEEPEEVNKKTKVEVNLSHFSLGMFKDPESNEWNIAKIAYDPLTQKAGIVEKIPCSTSKEYALERFRIQVGQLLMRNS